MSASATGSSERRCGFLAAEAYSTFQVPMRKLFILSKGTERVV